ncbi:hypothetical protein CMV_027376, partial [Castanea mollissima]
NQRGNCSFAALRNKETKAPNKQSPNPKALSPNSSSSNRFPVAQIKINYSKWEARVEYHLLI